MEKSKRIRIIERIAVFVGTILLLYFLFKFATYFMPFLIAGIIAILIEPIIKFCMNKLKLSRRVSSMIVVVLTIILIILAVVYGGSAIIREISNLSKNIPTAIATATDFINDVTKKIEEEFPELNSSNVGDVSGISTIQSSPDLPADAGGIDILEIMRNSIVEFIGKIGALISEWAKQAIKLLLSVPTMIINIVITILALVFFTKDRIYVIDMLEHHMPKSWIKKSVEVISEIFSTIGGYIRVYIKIIFITFVELYLAFNIINAIGLEIEYPLLLAILIAIVDILPVLGVGTVLIPWALWMFIAGNWGLRISFTNYIYNNLLY